MWTQVLPAGMADELCLGLEELPDTSAAFVSEVARLFHQRGHTRLPRSPTGNMTLVEP